MVQPRSNGHGGRAIDDDRHFLAMFFPHEIAGNIRLIWEKIGGGFAGDSKSVLAMGLRGQKRDAKFARAIFR